MAAGSNTEDMLKDDEFMQAVAQTIDALSFVRTHEPDMDFRAHSVNHLERVRGLQDEERRRVELMYGARAPSPDFLGTQLLAEYRGEAASVQLGPEPAATMGKTQGGAINWLNDAQCRAFKKEIKQRIHEWERAVRESTGQEEVLPEQKTPLRAIYELYKVCKNRVLSAEAAAAAAASGGNASRAGSTASSVVRNSGNMQDGTLSVSGNSIAVTPTSASAAAKPATQSARPSARVSGGGPAVPASANSNTATATVNASSSNNNNNNSGGSSDNTGNEEGAADHAYLPPATVPGLPAGLSAVEVSILKQLPKVTLGKTAAALMPEPAIVEEKRRIKQVLHCFESEFERLQGERPGRLHRRGLSREYHRYGELKNELARRNSAAAGAAAMVVGAGGGSVSAARPSSSP